MPACRPSSSTAPNGTKPRAPRTPRAPRFCRWWATSSAPASSRPTWACRCPGPYRQDTAAACRQRQHSSKPASPAAPRWASSLDEHLDTPMEHAALARSAGRPGLRHHAGDGRHRLRHRRGQVPALFLPARVLRLLPPLPPGHPGALRNDLQGGGGQSHPGRPGPDADPGPDHGGFRQLRPGMVARIPSSRPPWSASRTNTTPTWRATAPWGCARPKSIRIRKILVAQAFQPVQTHRQDAGATKTRTRTILNSKQ